MDPFCPALYIFFLYLSVLENLFRPPRNEKKKKKRGFRLLSAAVCKRIIEILWSSNAPKYNFYIERVGIFPRNINSYKTVHPSSGRDLTGYTFHFLYSGVRGTKWFS